MPNRLAGLLVLFLVALPGTPAVAQDPSRTRLILAETATREVEQDTLTAVLSVRATAAAASAAQAEVNRTMAAALERVRAVAAVRPATGGYRVYQERDREGRPRSWIAEQDLRLEAKDAAALLELVGDLQATGLAVGGFGYALSAEARRALENDLALEAIAALRAKAERIAAAMAMRVDVIDTVRVGDVGERPPIRPMFEARVAAAEVAPPVALPDLEPVSVRVEAEITLVPR